MDVNGVKDREGMLISKGLEGMVKWQTACQHRARISGERRPIQTTQHPCQPCSLVR
jgi:hypothetical protein